MKTKITRLLLSAVLMMCCMSTWADDVNYINERGQEQTCTTATEITNSSSTLSAGWYVVNGADVQTGTLVCQGTVNIILADGAKLTAQGGGKNPGIQVLSGDHLTIYGQAYQTGELYATGGGGTETAAGIGGGYNGHGSNITINGGIVTANGGNGAAGIGGGYYGNGSNITINGGTVTAKGGQFGAGIGGGHLRSGSNITINGGTVTAIGGDMAAGIGGGNDGHGSNITINGGTVTANGARRGAGIGGGNGRSGSNITINGGTVTANGGSDAAGIGGGYNGNGSNIKVKADHLVFVGDESNPTTEIQHVSDDDLTRNSDFCKRYVLIKFDPDFKANAIAAINAAIEGITDPEILDIVDDAITTINGATSVDVIALTRFLTVAKIPTIYAINVKIEGITNQDILDIADVAKANINDATSADEIVAIGNSTLEVLEIPVKYYKSGRTEGIELGKAEAFGGMAITPQTDCPAVKVTKDNKVVILYAPDQVEMIKISANK